MSEIDGLMDDLEYVEASYLDAGTKECRCGSDQSGVCPYCDGFNEASARFRNIRNAIRAHVEALEQRAKDAEDNLAAMTANRNRFCEAINEIGHEVLGMTVENCSEQAVVREIRAHVDGLEKRVKDAEADNVALTTINGDIVDAANALKARALPPGVTLEEVRGVLSDALPHVIAHSAVYARDYGLEITGDKDQVTAQWHPVHREIYDKLTTLLAKLTAQPAEANGKDEGE